MPLQPESKSIRRWVVAAGTARYESPANPELSQVPIELNRITTAFAGAGYSRLPGVTDPDRDQLRKLFTKAKKEIGAGDLLVAYYTGHGARGADRFYLLTRESDHEDLGETALAAEDLARALTEGSKASQVLVILDACYAGAGAADFAQVASRLTVALGGAGPGVFVLAAARTKQEAEQGALSSALEQALANPDERLGGRVQPFLAIDEVMGAIEDYLQERHPKQVATWSSVNVQGRCRLFPNPHHRSGLRPGLDLETQRAFIEHWVLKARGAEIGAAGWYFTGREQALRELAAWLREADSGGRPRVVTGGAGAGKSAVLARLVTLADPAYRADVLALSAASPDPTTLPPASIVDVAVHARRKFLADLVAQIARVLKVTASEPDELIDAIARREDKTVIVVDALDEADDTGQIETRLLRGLVGLPRVFLLVGTRPDSSVHGQRFRAMGESVVEIDLDDPRYIGADDIARYVERRLLAAEEPARETPYRQFPLVAKTVARAVAQRAQNVFLVAHTAVIALLAEQTVIDITQLGWIDRLPTGFDDAFQKFLSDIDRWHPGGLSSTMTRAALLPLAFAEGEGLPWADLWAAVAAGTSGLSVSDADIVLIRKHAAAFIIEAMESERSVYRLYHERIAEYLRGPVDAGRTQRSIVEALRALVPRTSGNQEPDWTHAHPYLLAHLATHALKAGVIGELAQDGLFLAAAEPLRILQALARATDPFSQRAYRSYALAFRILRDRPTEDRLSYLEMSARRLGDDALANMWTRRRHTHRWAVPWASGSLVSPHRVVGASSKSVRSVVFGRLEGLPVIVSSGDDGTVRVWDLATGAPHGEALRGHEGSVNSVALGTLEGRPVIVSGGDDGTVRVWDLATGTPRSEALRRHEGSVHAIALGTLEGRAVLIFSVGIDGTVRVRDLATGVPHGEPMHGHEGWVKSIALGTLENRPVIVADGFDDAVRVWDLATRAPHGEPLRGHEGWVNSIALGTLEGRPVIVSAADDRTVRVWDMATGAPCGEPMRGHESAVTSVAAGSLEGRPMIVSGGRDGTVRVWDMATGALRGKPLLGHEGWVHSIALGTLEGRPVTISGGSDGTVRVWDLLASAPQYTASRGPGTRVCSVALGKVEGRPVIISGGSDYTVQMWDLATGAPRGEVLPAPRHRVTSVAIGALYGKTVIVSGDSDGTVQVSDPATGGRLSEELRGHTGSVDCVGLGALDGRPMIISGGSDGTVRVWDYAMETSYGEALCGHEGGVTSIGLGIINGRTVLVSGGSDGTVRVLELATGALRWQALRGHEGSVDSVALGTLEGRAVIFSSGSDCTVRVWDLATGAPCGEPLRSHEGTVDLVALGALEGRAVVISSDSDCTMRVRDLATGAPCGEPLRSHEGGASSGALGTLDGRPVIVSGGHDNTLQVWDLATGAPRRKVFRSARYGVTSVAIDTLDGRQVIVTGGSDSAVRVWDLATGAPRGRALRGHDGSVHSVALCMLEGRPVIVSAGSDGAIRVWDLATGAPHGEPLLGHEGSVDSVALGTFEGRSVIISGGYDSTVRVWDLATGLPRGEPLRGHEGSVYAVALGTLQGRSVIISGGYDSTVRMWDLATGTPRGEAWRGHESSVYAVAFGTIQSRPVIVTGRSDDTVRVWDAMGNEDATVYVGSAISAIALAENGSVVVACSAGLMAVQFHLEGL